MMENIPSFETDKQNYFDDDSKQPEWMVDIKPVDVGFDEI